MFDVITVGSSTIDVFAGVESEEIKIKTKEGEEELIAYPCGSKILIKELEFLTGGGGTNTAVCFSRLGLKTAYLGKIGVGTNSGLILKKLSKEKVKFVGIKSKKHHAGYSFVLESLSGDRTILTYKGANNYLDYKEIDKKNLKTNWFYFSSMVEKSYETLEKLSDYAKENNIRIAFNPSNYLAEKGKDFLSNLLKNTYLLILNKEESELIVGKGNYEELIISLMKLGPKIVVITDGKKGAYTIENSYLYNVIPNKVHAIETTGAGDAFASTFLGCVIKGKSTGESMKLASINAGFVILEKGAKKGLSKYPKLIKVLKTNPPVLEKKKLNK
jgi:ribokinase